MARTERESDRKRREENRNGRLVGAAETSKQRAEWRRLQRKNLSILGLPEKERVVSVPQREQLARTPEPPLPKGKRNRDVCPKYHIMRGMRVKMGESRTLARKRGIRARAWSGKGGLHRERGKIPRRKGRASNKNLPRTTRRKHERVSERKSSPGRSAESWFHSKSGQT